MECISSGPVTQTYLECRHLQNEIQIKLELFYLFYLVINGLALVSVVQTENAGILFNSTFVWALASVDVMLCC